MEKVKRSGARGERLQEAIYINQGLLALKSVLSALNKQQSYVPFQDSKLTMMLRRSLSGGAQTCVLLAARPEADHATETLQVRRLAMRDGRCAPPYSPTTTLSMEPTHGSGSSSYARHCVLARRRPQWTSPPRTLVPMQGCRSPGLARCADLVTRAEDN